MNSDQCIQLNANINYYNILWLVIEMNVSNRFKNVHIAIDSTLLFHP